MAAGRCAQCGGEHEEGVCPGRAVAPTVPLAADAPQPSLIPPGTLLEGVYRVGACIGQGATGAVYAVEHVELGKRFAVKVLAARAGADPEAIERLRNEARAASAIEHENIVNVTHLGRTERGSVFVVMELLEGEDLRARLVRQVALGGSRWLPDEESQSIGEQILAGLGAAHRAGIVHRDLKPENVLLAKRSGRAVVKLVDFGVSKLGTPSDVRLTRTGQVFGTPLYMSPEQGRSTADVDHRTDLYAVGVMLYEVTTGTVPFDGESVAECLVKHATEPPPALTARRPDLPPAVAAVILKCLAKKPEDRYASADEVAEAWRVAWRVAPGPHLELSGTLEPTSRPVPPAAAMRRAGRATYVLAGLVAVGMAAWLGTSATTDRPARHRDARARSAAAAPLADEDSVLACPLLRASGVEEPSGWLGAAAAATVCERARVILGGRYERTLVPAELLDLPRAPVDDFPVDPYGKPDAHERSAKAARARADAFVEGEVTSKNPGFRVSLRLVAKDGHELARGEGRGRALYEAARVAMEPLVAGGALPKASRLDPEIAEWSRATTVDAALALSDVAHAHNQIGEWLPGECARVLAVGPAIRENRTVQSWWCAAQTGQAQPQWRALPLDDLSRGALRSYAESSIYLGADTAKLSELFDRLEQAGRTEPSALGRALLLGTQSCLAQTVAPDRALDLAILAAEAHPETSDGGMCTPWMQLMTIRSEATKAQRAWLPWLFWPSLDRPNRDVAFLRRALILGPLNYYHLEDFVWASLGTDRLQDARRAALRLTTGPVVPWRPGGELLLARVDAAEARFRSALDRASRAAAPASGDAGWVATLRVKSAWEALQIAAILGEDQEHADRLSTILVAAGTGVSMTELNAHLIQAASCARASPPTRRPCFHRLRTMPFTNDPPGTAELVAGLERYAAGDVRGATVAWRPCIRTPELGAETLGAEMARAFDATGEFDLAERVDAAAERTSSYAGASLANVRQARRAARRGDRERALALARKVIDAWSVADAEVPAVGEMRALVARLGRDR